MLKILIPIFLVLMVGCSTINGEVYKMGSDTFSVSGGASGQGSIPRNDVKARDSAYQTAQAHCSKISKNMLVMTEQFISSYAGSTMKLAILSYFS